MTLLGNYCVVSIFLLAASLAGSCSPKGDQQGGDGGSDSDTDTATNSDNGNECDEIDFPLAGQPPSIVVLVDRSGSMSLGDQWQILVQVLTDITAQMDNQIRFALMMFPYEQGFCQPAPLTPSVALADENSGAIAAVLNSTSPLGPGTPTAMSLRSAYLYLLDEDVETRKFVLLATDGAPNCSTDPTLSCDSCVSSETGQDCIESFICLDDQMTYGQVIEYHDNWDINTYVVGMGGVIEVFDDVMNNIAYHGGTDSYYPAQTPEALTQAFQEIAAETTECTFFVDWTTLGEGTSTNPDLVNIYADGLVATYSEDCQQADGWHWLDENTVELCEDLCHDYRWGVVSEISATFGCESYVE